MRIRANFATNLSSWWQALRPRIDTRRPRSLTTAAGKKLGGFDFYHEVLGSPKYVVAPMIEQSELAWRKLSRRYGAQLVYTPMINSKGFSDPKHHKFREQSFNTTAGEEGGPEDRPLIVQLGANDPEKLLACAKIVEPYCDAVDVNLGCPQDFARRNHIGSWLQDDWGLIYDLINILHRELSIPVTAKFRVFPSLEKTVEYAKMLEHAGAQILTCHGRTREQRGRGSGLADWDKIRAVKEAVSVPIFANGNVLFHGDIERVLNATGADAVMCAESNLHNPALFLPATHHTPREASPTVSAFSSPPALLSPSSVLPVSSYLTGAHPRHTTLALEYLDIVKTQQTPTQLTDVKAHIFRLLRPALSRETDLREQLGRIKPARTDVATWEMVVKDMDERMERDARETEGQPLESLVTVDALTGLPILPYWLAQPYVRGPLNEPIAIQRP